MRFRGHFQAASYALVDLFAEDGNEVIHRK